MHKHPRSDEGGETDSSKDDGMEDGELGKRSEGLSMVEEEDENENENENEKGGTSGNKKGASLGEGSMR
jgi:hypothetical protein